MTSRKQQDKLSLKQDKRAEAIKYLQNDCAKQGARQADLGREFQNCDASTNCYI